MTYNPFLDLTLGLFLILVPVGLLIFLAYLVISHDRNKGQTPTAAPSQSPPEEWSSWVRQTLEEAKDWRSRLSQTSNTQEMDCSELIRVLEGLSKDSVPPDNSSVDSEPHPFDSEMEGVREKL